ncbi:MAG: hypothetical protein R2681_10060 [Pyrinomonadaceae bacterium]
MTVRLSKKDLGAICRKLAKSDPALGHIFNTYGEPPLWDREPGFSTLVHIILEQQVSLASALSAFNKLNEKIGKITPKKVLGLSDAEMKSCYFSRQKTAYVRHLAESVIEKRLDLEAIEQLSDEEAKTELEKIKGIGNWTSDIYLLMVLLRRDVMPKGDIALHSAYQKLHGMEKRPGSDEFIELTQKWTPYRSVAARLLWHFYLSEKGKGLTAS